MIRLCPSILVVQRCTKTSVRDSGGLMKQDIARYVAKCDVCRRIKAEHQRTAGTLQPISIPEWKWVHVEMDFVTGFPKSRKGNDAILVVIDRLSKVAHFLAVRETITASQLATLYCPELFHFTVFHWLSVRTMAACSLQDSGQVSKKLWELICHSVLRFISIARAS